MIYLRCGCSFGKLGKTGLIIDLLIFQVTCVQRFHLTISDDWHKNKRQWVTWRGWDEVRSCQGRGISETIWYVILDEIMSKVLSKNHICFEILGSKWPGPPIPRSLTLDSTWQPGPPPGLLSEPPQASEQLLAKKQNPPSTLKEQQTITVWICVDKPGIDYKCGVKLLFLDE